MNPLHDTHILPIHVFPPPPLRVHNVDVLLIDIDECPGCQIHHGFYTNYAAIQSQVQEAVDTFTSIYPKAPIIVTGK